MKDLTLMTTYGETTLIWKTALSFSLALVMQGAFASEYQSCMDEAMTQSHMTRCAGIGFEEADWELNRIYQEIRRLYAEDETFLEKLKQSQMAWIKLRDADLELEYPSSDPQAAYGSVLPMCLAGHKAYLTWQRVDFLKRWIEGSEEGDVCSGSVMGQSQLTRGLLLQ